VVVDRRFFAESTKLVERRAQRDAMVDGRSAMAASWTAPSERNDSAARAGDRSADGLTNTAVPSRERDAHGSAMIKSARQVRY